MEDAKKTPIGSKERVLTPARVVWLLIVAGVTAFGRPKCFVRYVFWGRAHFSSSGAICNVERAGTS